MRILLTYILIFWLTIANGQTFDSISYQYKQLQQRRIDTLIEFTKSKNNNAWLNLLPSINYDVDRSSLNVGISLANFSNYYQQKQRNKIELAKLQETLEERLSNKLIQLENEYLKLQLEVKIQETKYKNTADELEYILLKKEQFKHHKLILENWLKIKQTFLERLNKNIAQIDNQQLQISQFKNKIRYPFQIKIETTLRRLLEIYTDLKLKVDE